MPPVADHSGPGREAGALPPEGQGQPGPEAATRLSGPLFRDDLPTPAPAVEQTAVLPPITGTPRPAASPCRRSGPWPWPRADRECPVAARARRQRPPGTGEPRGADRADRSRGAGERCVAERPRPVRRCRRQRGRPQGPSAPKAPKAPKAGRNLRAAVGVGVGLGVVVVISLVIVKWLFVGVVAAVVWSHVGELTSRLKESKGIQVPLPPLALGGVAMLVAAYLGGPEASVVALALTCLAVLVWRMAQPPEDYLRDVTAGVFTAFYVPFLATFVMLLLAAHDGPQRVALFMVLTVCSDTGAYAAGSRFGKHKLAPRISPGKTREGLAGGVLLCMVAGALGMQFLIKDGHWWQGLVLGACVAVSATLGDLGESMIKRDLGIKDMGTILPGHGGIMDRLDSLLPTAPVVWLVLVGFVGAG
ncbi:phosphatidate cytidylyltransferase [Streptacidiphilus sp. 4-A2]|nr:phosphatidate cytidylyltransferase [Streptacidiphilus sp. 4-A2]